MYGNNYIGQYNTVDYFRCILDSNLGDDENDNDGNNHLRFFDTLPNFLFITSEMKLDY